MRDLKVIYELRFLQIQIGIEKKKAKNSKNNLIKIIAIVLLY